ncbi:MAG: PVC-type heme-binding CxxCH protein [Planctomycetaceae bacterium]
MRRRSVGSVRASLTVAASALFICPGTPVFAGTFRAGAAVVDITPRNAPPEPPSIVAGGFLEGRAARVTDPLYVRAIVLDDGGGPDAAQVGRREPVRIALVVVDTCMMPQALIDEAKALAAERSGILRERMLVSATHTHAAPAAMGCLGTRVDAPYAARLPAAIAAAIVAASERLEPAAIGHGAVDDWEHTHNRRWIRRPETRVVDPFGSPTGLANMHPGHLSRDVIGPSGPVDPQLSVLSIRSEEGRPLGMLACYSQHYFGSPAVSADYFGHFCRAMATSLGVPGDGNGPFVCALAQGTSGDLMWMDYGAPKRQVAVHEYAAAVARRAREVIDRLEHRDDVTLAMAERKIDLAYRVPDEARLAWARPIAAGIVDDLPKNLPEVYAREALILHQRQRTTLTLQAVRIGDATIAALPNETYALTGLKLRARSPASLHFTIELANGAEGYIPPPEQHVLGGYTTWPARTAGLEVAAEPRIVDALVDALTEVTGRPTRVPTDVHGPAARVVLDAGPIGLWRCEDDEGATLRNAIDGGGHATLTPGFAWYLRGVRAGTGTGVGEIMRPGVFSGPESINRAIHLAGGEITLPQPAAPGDATLVTWVWLGERSGATVREGVVCEGLAAEDVVARQDADHLVRFDLGSSRGRATHRADEWQRIAVVRRDGVVAVYVDGAAEPDVTGPACMASSALVIGRGLEGKVDEIAWFARALSPAELANFWTASGVAEERALAEDVRRSAEEQRVRQAAAPKLPDDHAARVTALGPARFWRLEQPPEDGVVSGAVRFAPGAFGSFQGGRITARDDALDDAWSVAFWFRTDMAAPARPVTPYLFSRGPQGDRDAPGDHLGIGGTAPGTVQGRLLVFNGNRANGVLAGRTELPERSWNHVVMARKGDRITVWLNGASEPDIDGVLAVTAPESRECFVGSRSDDFAPLEGHLAAFAHFDRAVEASEARALFTASGLAPGEPLPVGEPPAGPRTPEETRRGIRVPPGYRVELVAAEPDVLDPVAFDWDAAGRLWVVEMADYPSGIDGAGKPGGRVRVLEDADGDGRYETSRLFASGLSFPNGIVTWRDGVIVTAAPRIVFLRDTDGDGHSDREETLLEGFMEGNQQLRVNGLRRGLDTTLWCASGGHHGGHGAQTVISSPRAGRTYALGSHDFRFDPDSGEVWIESGPSQVGLCRDPYGHWFGTQNANPLWHWVIADRHVARNPFVAPERTVEHLIGPGSPPVRPASPPEKRFHNFHQAGRFTSACGSTVDQAGTLFADGSLHAFTCEPFHNLVQHNVLTDAGATFTASWPEAEGPTDFFAADDSWCRPVMARVGPDGGLWIADMYRNVIEHPDWLPPSARAELQPRYRLGDDRGRIWRVVRDGGPHGRFPEAVRRAATPLERVALLDSASAWQRDLASSQIVHDTDPARRLAALTPLADLAREATRAEVRLQALWTLESLGSLDDSLVVVALGDADRRVREQAVRIAERRDSPIVIDRAVVLAHDPDAKVCLQDALACGAWPGRAAADALAEVARRFSGDAFMRTAVVTSAITHFEAFAAAVAKSETAVRSAFQDPLVRMTAGRRDRAVLATLLDAALESSEERRTV